MTDEKMDTEILEKYETHIYAALEQYCSDNGIEDLKRESQSVFYAALRYIQRIVFKDTSVLRLKGYIYNINDIMPSNHYSYDYDLLDTISDIYINICLSLNKECTLIGFSFITGIPYDTIISWNDRRDEVKLTPKSYQLWKKLISIDQETLFSRLYSGTVNPVGIFGIGKQRFGWDDKRTEQTITVNHVISANELPKLAAKEGAKTSQISAFGIFDDEISEN